MALHGCHETLAVLFSSLQMFLGCKITKRGAKNLTSALQPQRHGTYFKTHKERVLT